MEDWQMMRTTCVVIVICLESMKVFLAECVIDSLSLYQMGIKNTTCTFGKNGLTQELIGYLYPNVENIFVCFDQKADNAAQKVADTFAPMGINVYRVSLREQFQRMLSDIELGKINAVMFTELSRFSRSLKDFLNIFEFMRHHEIDTTNAYSALITKILMIFAEFEREMTAERTRQNALERAKRGLAGGGVDTRQ